MSRSEALASYYQAQADGLRSVAASLGTHGLKFLQLASQYEELVRKVEQTSKLINADLIDESRRQLVTVYSFASDSAGSASERWASEQQAALRRSSVTRILAP